MWGQVVGGVVHIHLSVGEGEGLTRTVSLAEEGRAGILSWAAAKAVATCLLGLRCALGSDGDTPRGGGGLCSG